MSIERAGVAGQTARNELGDRLDAFAAELLVGAAATRLLERRAGGRVHAEVDRALFVAPAAEQRARLELGADPVGYRSVRLMHGATILSEAEIWFVPGRLDPAMVKALAETDRPFGTVIAGLLPTRRTLSVERPGDEIILRVRALVMSSDGLPLAEVSEAYRPAALGR